jgi:hypothetical protein
MYCFVLSDWYKLRGCIFCSFVYKNFYRAFSTNICGLWIYCKFFYVIDITFVREYRADLKQPPPSLRVQLPQETSIAALSVVNSHHHGSSASGNTSLQQQQHLTIPSSGTSGAAILQHVPQMQATITPCSTTANDMPREGLVVVQVMLIYIFFIKILTACHLNVNQASVVKKKTHYTVL